MSLTVDHGRICGLIVDGDGSLKTGAVRAMSEKCCHGNIEVRSGEAYGKEKYQT